MGVWRFTSHIWNKWDLLFDFLCKNTDNIILNHYFYTGYNMSSNFNMSFDPATRQAFGELVADYGLTIPQAFKLFANQSIKTGTLALSFDWRTNQTQQHTLTPKAQERLRQSQQELLQGDYSTYDSLNELMADINHDKA